MSIYCKAIHCSNKTGCGKQFFQFPNPQRSQEDKLLCKLWINHLRNRKLDPDNFKWTKSKRVCEDHFEADCFEGYFHNYTVAKSLNFFQKKKTLKKGSIPTKINVGDVKNQQKKSTIDVQKKSGISKVDIILRYILIYTISQSGLFSVSEICRVGQFSVR